MYWNISYTRIVKVAYLAKRIRRMCTISFYMILKKALKKKIGKEKVAQLKIFGC